MKRLPGYLTAKLNLTLYPGTLATVLFTLSNGLAGTDFWSTPLYRTYPRDARSHLMHAFSKLTEHIAIAVTPPKLRF